MLDSLKLRSVRCSYIACSPCCRSFGCIFDLCPCQWLWDLLVFALILNFDIGSRRVTHCSINSLFSLIVVNFSNFLHPLLLTHIEGLMRWTSNGGPLWVTTCPSLSRSWPMPQKHDGPVCVISLPIMVHVSRLPWVNSAMLFKSNFWKFSSWWNTRGDITGMVGRYGRHIRRIDIVNGICTFACIEAGVHELLRLILRVHLIRSSSTHTILLGVIHSIHRHWTIEIHRWVNGLLQRETHALIQRSTTVTQSNMSASSTTKGLLTHAHRSIALAIMGTHLLLG